jgi:sorting nexin-29
LKEKKREYELQCQVQLLATYFGPEQKDYWRVFFSERVPTNPLSDVAAWTDYFRALLGAVPEALLLSDEELALRAQLFDAAPKGAAEDMAELNAPVTLEEARACMLLPTGRAADLQGFTGELLKGAGSEVPVRGQDIGRPVCPPAIECAQWLLQQLLSSGQVPDSMCVSKLVPVPKSTQPAALGDRDMYRGISVSALFSRLLDRLMNKRFEGVVSRLGLRSPTQCGFRPGHGTLDAIFTLHHLISAAQHNRQRLFVVFVDFKKAFDTVRRDLLLERCRQLGVHGQFMEMLVGLYDRVCCQVDVNGELGEQFATAAGTKQGSELSPLLFGLFIELLHELIQLQVEGAGPVLGSLRVPDIMYADDVALISHTATGAQQLLDVLDVFCKLFGMQVNLAPRKTCVVVFRPGNMPAPSGLQLLYRGHPVAVQREYTYLGVRLHDTRGLAYASDALAASGSKAMHALLTRCRRSNLTQFDIKGRMFDVLVEPVLSYASHIWGPMAFKKHLLRNPYGTKAEKVHTSYLRIMTGVGKGAALDVVYRDLHRLPVVYHWVALAVRWWNRMQLSHGRESQCMASYAWVEDVKLALAGSKSCWSFHVLSAMADLRLLQPDWRRQPLDWVLGRRWEEPAVKLAVAGVFKARWQVDGMVDPRQAPSRGVSMCTHHKWVYPLDPGIQDFSRGNAPAYTKLCLPFSVLRVLAQLRIGWAHLEVEQGRKRRPKVPREARLCRLCSGDDSTLARRQAVLARTGTSANVEDLKHFVLECPVYDEIRAACAAFPVPVPASLDDPDCLVDIFSHEAQSSLAHTLYKMKVHRAHLLGLSNGI